MSNLGHKFTRTDTLAYFCIFKNEFAALFISNFPMLMPVAIIKLNLISFLFISFQWR